MQKINDHKPLFTIITVCLNAEKTIEHTILSVRNQTFRDFEHIIIDGSSIDGTLEIIDQYRDGFSVVISEPDKGIYDAMNKGLRLAHGEYIGILNADDYYEDNALEIIKNTVTKHEGIDVFHGDARIIDTNNNDFVTKRANALSKITKGMYIFHPSVFVSSICYKDIGKFDTSFPVAADWDLMLRLWVQGYHFYYISEVITNFRLGGMSSGSSATLEHFLEKHRIRKKNRLYAMIDWYFIFELVKCILPRKILKRKTLKNLRSGANKSK